MAKTMTKKNGDVLTHDEDPLLSYSEAGRQIGRSHECVRRWVRDGLLNGYRMPTGVKAVRQSEINKILRASQLEAEIRSGE